MDNSLEIYKAKVWEFLDSMQAGDAYLIENLFILENREMFVQCVKSYNV